MRQASAPFLIGITGSSGAGKTELARAVGQKVPAPVYSLDSYYRDLAHLTLAERAATNFDDPSALEHELLLGQLEALLNQKPIHKPIYNFDLHVRMAETEIVLP